MQFTRRGRQTVGITVTVRNDNPIMQFVQTARATLAALPEGTLLGLTAGSVGVGTGLYLARSRRLLLAVGVVPALIAGVALVLQADRPAQTAAGERRQAPQAQGATT